MCITIIIYLGPNNYNTITVACVKIGSVKTFQITCTIINYARVSRLLTNCRVIGSIHHKLVIIAIFGELYLAIAVIAHPIPQP